MCCRDRCSADKNNGHSVQAVNVCCTHHLTQLSGCFFRIQLAKKNEMNELTENKSGLSSKQLKIVVYLYA